MLTIEVNGQQRTVDDGTTVAALLQLLELPTEGVAVEINRRIVPRRTHGETLVVQGDEIEVVTFVGGG